MHFDIEYNILYRFKENGIVAIEFRCAKIQHPNKMDTYFWGLCG